MLIIIIFVFSEINSKKFLKIRLNKFSTYQLYYKQRWIYGGDTMAAATIFTPIFPQNDRFFANSGLSHVNPAYLTKLKPKFP